jgi:hypothetical protein
MRNLDVTEYAGSVAAAERKMSQDHTEKDISHQHQLVL